MSDAQSAMTTWIGTLAHGGLLTSPLEEAGVTVAAYVVGEERLSELREWLVAQPAEELVKQRVAAVEICIWMANADRNLDPEEAHLLKEIILWSELDDDTQDRLVEAVHEPPSLEGIEERLTHPVLRELMLALAWELAHADGKLAGREEAFLTGLAKRLEIAPERARELHAAITDRIGQLPG